MKKLHTLEKHFINDKTEIHTLKVGKSFFTLTPEGEIMIGNANASIRITPQGELYFIGKQLKHVAKEEIILQGEKAIHLNSP